MCIAYFSKFKWAYFSVQLSLNLSARLPQNYSLSFLCSVQCLMSLNFAGFLFLVSHVILLFSGFCLWQALSGIGELGNQGSQLLSLSFCLTRNFWQKLSPSNLLQPDKLTGFRPLSSDPGLWAPVSPFPLQVLAVQGGRSFLKLLISGWHYLLYLPS